MGERQIPKAITYMWNLKKKKNDTNELIYETNRLSDLNVRLPRGKVVGKDKLRVWDCHIHTTIYKIDKQGPTV